jgi:DNA polymerase elongation subunit (family B)
MRILPTPTRRNVVLDIETLSLDPTDPKGALSALTGRIVCIGMLFDDGESITEESFTDRDERDLLIRFWEHVEQTDLFIGHNVLNFDLPFIRQRSWILSVRPSRRIDLRRFYSMDLLDTMQIWCNWGATKYPGLDEVGRALGCGGKTGSGLQVAEWWSAGDITAIADYCREDVRLTYKLFCRLMFWPIPDRFAVLETILSPITSL